MSTTPPSNQFVENPEKFISGLYHTRKGELRVRQLVADITEILGDRLNADKVAHPQLISRIIDIGCGNAPVTLELMKKYPKLRAVLIDPSEKMLKEAQNLASRLNVAPERFETKIGLLEELTPHDFSRGDLVICHGVVNWTSNPLASILYLFEITVAANAYISLAFGQITGHALGFIRGGNIECAEALLCNPSKPIESKMSERGIIQLDGEHVLKTIQSLNRQILLAKGIRVFFDLVSNSSSLDENQVSILIELEDALRSVPLYRSISNMMHLIIVHADEP